MARVFVNGPFNNVHEVVQLYQGANTSIFKYFEDNFKPGNGGVRTSLQLYYPSRTILWTICKNFEH